MSETAHSTTCDICEGTGKVPDHDTGKLVGNQWIVEHFVTCWSCGGSGVVRTDGPTADEPTGDT